MRNDNGVIKKQSAFFQSKMNEAKMGAYFTDADHCRWIANFLEFPEEEVCCIDPSIGNAAAVLIATGKKEIGSNTHIFGVELNKDRAEEVKNNPFVNQCLQADFLTDVLITNQSFSFAFVNPPYGTFGEENQRYEIEFLQKLTPYLTKDAVAVFVVPQYVLADTSFLSLWCSAYTTKHAYRFHQKEYEKYKQIVLIGIKKAKKILDRKEHDYLKEAAEDLEGFMILPEQNNGDKIRVPKSLERNLYQFTTRVFHPEVAEKCVIRSLLNQMVLEKLRIPPYQIDNLGRPPIMPSDGQMYLLAVSGAGQGLVGSEENHDLHLQRGIAKNVTSSSYVAEENGTTREVLTRYPQIQYNLIEGDGRITTLK